MPFGKEGEAITALPADGCVAAHGTCDGGGGGGLCSLADGGGRGDRVELPAPPAGPAQLFMSVDGAHIPLVGGDSNYPDTDGDGDIWNDFRTTMQGANVTIDVDHSATGNVYVTATAVGTNGTTLVETYQQPVSATADIVAFLVCDGSYFEMKKAYLIPSKVTVVEDVNPVSIAIAGAPAFIEFGNANFWGDAIATVTFADGSSEEVDSSDITFTVIPDMTSLGVKTVTVAYSKTKQGAYSPGCNQATTLWK